MDLTLKPSADKLAGAYHEEVVEFIKISQIKNALDTLSEFAKNYRYSEEEDTVYLYFRKYESIRIKVRNNSESFEEIEAAYDALSTQILALARDLNAKSKAKPDRVFGIIQSAKSPEVHDTTNGSGQDSSRDPSVHSGQDSSTNSKIHRARTTSQTDKIIEELLVGSTRPIVARCAEIKKSYPGNSFSLNSLSFDLVAGEITAVLGMNASGKTTILKILMGQIAPDSGTVTFPFLSRSATDWRSVKNRIAYVPQMPDQWHGSIRQNLNYVAATFGTTGSNNKELVSRYVSRYGLSEHQEKTWNELSGGFRIRFELVKALLSNPSLLVLDEPLAYLDVVTQQIFLSDVRSISSSLTNPIPVIITSQHIYEVETIANKIIVVNDGNCIYSGNIDQLPPDGKITCILDTELERSEIEKRLQKLGLSEIESVMGGFIVEFTANKSIPQFLSKIVEQLNADLISIRDISSSTRRLFRNRPHDVAIHGS